MTMWNGILLTICLLEWALGKFGVDGSATSFFALVNGSPPKPFKIVPRPSAGGPFLFFFFINNCGGGLQRSSCESERLGGDWQL